MHSYNTILYRIIERKLRSNCSQQMKSWVRRLHHYDVIIIVLYTLCECSFLSQYIFMFQVPWLPEALMGLHDYQMFNAMFRGSKAVSISLYTLALTLSHTHVLTLTLSFTHTCTHTLSLRSRPPLSLIRELKIRINFHQRLWRLTSTPSQSLEH